MGKPGVEGWVWSLWNSEKSITWNFTGHKLLVWVITICQTFSQISSYINLMRQESLIIFYRWRDKFSERQATGPSSHSQAVKLESYPAAWRWLLLVAETKTQFEKCNFIQLRSGKNLKSILPLPPTLAEDRSLNSLCTLPPAIIYPHYWKFFKFVCLAFFYLLTPFTHFSHPYPPPLAITNLSSVSMCSSFGSFVLFCFLIYFWLRWVFVAVRRLSLVAVSGGYSLLQWAGFSLQWLLLLRSTGSRHVGFSSCGMRAQ